MKAWIFSDLHLETAPFSMSFRPPAADVCIVAGDVLTRGGVRTMRYLGQNICPWMPVVAVAGNHEFFGASIVEGLQAARAEASRHRGLHFLEHDWVEVNDVVFAGATLWTDFRLFVDIDPALVMRHCGQVLNDYRKIAYRKTPYERLHPAHVHQLHRAAAAFLARFLQIKSHRKTVVVTHHAPSASSVPPEHSGDWTSAAYASDLENLIQDFGPAVWVHGHVHERLRYRIGKTTVVCNPRGYPGEPSFEDFDREHVIEF